MRLVTRLAAGHRFRASPRVRLASIATEAAVDLPAGTTGRVKADRAFAAAGLRRTVAFEVTYLYVMARLARVVVAYGLPGDPLTPGLMGP